MRRERLLLLLSLTANVLLLAGLLYVLSQLARAKAVGWKQHLQSEMLHKRVSELETAAKAASASPPALTDTEVLELARLRNEVTRLRNEQRLAPKAGSSPAPKLPLATNPPPAALASPVTTLTATLSANVGLGHALAFGGWTSPTPGKRIVGLLTPDVDASAPGAVMVATRLIEFPDAAMEQLGLQGLRTGQTHSQGQAHFTAEQLAALLKWAEQTDGVDMLTSPRIITRSGQAAQLAVQAYSDSTNTGPVINLTPTLDPTGASVRLDVGIELKLPAPTQP